MEALPRSDLSFFIDTNASSYQMRAALLQVYLKRMQKPVGFCSLSLTSHEKNYSVLEKKCLAVVFFIQTPHLSFQGSHFTVYSDQASL